MSLAAFMGGRANGPRLNKHAPQQDAHDPTQFEQRTSITAPHPVFGRGGVAMPGMTAKARLPSSAKPSINEHSGRVGQSNLGSGGEYEDSAQRSAVKPQDTGRRVRTMSTPTGASMSRSSQGVYGISSTPSTPMRTYGVGVKTAELQSRTPERRSKTPDMRPKTPESRSKTPERRSKTPERHSRTPEVRTKTPELRSKTPELRSKTPELRSKTPEMRPKTPENRQITPQGRRFSTTGVATSPPPSASTMSHLFTPRQIALPSLSTPPSSRKSPITTPSLARPIQPVPKVSPQGPKIIPSQSPSPAFLRPAAQKDLTPSLSRLKGRGFVQSMVKVSSQMESMATGAGGSPTPGDKAKPTSPGKPSVLDRWSTASNSDRIAPLVSSSLPNSMVRAASVPQPSSPVHNISARTIIPTDTGKSRKIAPSPPSVALNDGNPPDLRPSRKKSLPNITSSEGTRGLGSSSTVISYIKTNKTGDAPLDLPTQVQPAEIDELGVRGNGGALHDRSARKPTIASELPASSGKPLSHVRSFW